MTELRICKFDCKKDSEEPISVLAKHRHIGISGGSICCLQIHNGNNDLKKYYDPGKHMSS